MNLPWGYVVTLAFLAVGTLCALAPARRPRRLTMLSLHLGVAGSELPFAAFALLLASTVLAVVQSGLSSPESCRTRALRSGAQGGEFTDAAVMRGGGSHQNHAIYRYRRTGDGWRLTERVYELRYVDESPLAGSAPEGP